MSLRPILKRKSSPSSSHSPSSCSSSVKSTVSFASNIATTYLAHSSLQYDRTPISQPNFIDCAMPRGRPLGRDPRICGDVDLWADVADIDGYDSVMIREDEGSEEYYDSLTPLPPPSHTSSVYAPSPSAYLSYHSGRSELPSPTNLYRSSSTFMPGMIAPAPKRKLSDSSDASYDSSWSSDCLDGF